MLYFDDSAGDLRGVGTFTDDICSLQRFLTTQPLESFWFHNIMFAIFTNIGPPTKTCKCNLWTTSITNMDVLVSTLGSGIVVLVGIIVLVGIFARINKHTGGNQSKLKRFLKDPCLNFSLSCLTSLVLLSLISISY